MSEQSPAAILGALSGPRRGRWFPLAEETVDVVGDSPGDIRIARPGESSESVLARFHPAAGEFELEVLPDARIWRNGERFTGGRLTSGDLLEFGDHGAIFRYRTGATRRSDSMRDIFADCVDRTRADRRSRRGFPWRLARNVVSDFSSRSTIRFRVIVSVVLICVVALLIVQFARDTRIERRLESSEELAQALEAARRDAERNALTDADVDRLRRDLLERTDVVERRLQTLEERSQAINRVIASATPSVIFLQGAWAYRHLEDGGMLRYFVDDEGNQLHDPSGRPLIELDGNGPVAERHFTGTGFIVSAEGHVMTNRHVAIPWEDDRMTAVLADQGYQAEFSRFIGYLPGRAESFDVSTLATSEKTDLAILQCGSATAEFPHLELTTEPPSSGDEVVVLGYPTGLRAMLARTNPEFLARLEESGDTGFWDAARRLAEAGYIQPLASRGIVGQVSDVAVIYDADTTRGGSGGPVLGIDGRVVAVNAAILKDYAGANIGVPVDGIRELIEVAR